MHPICCDAQIRVAIAFYEWALQRIPKIASNEAIESLTGAHTYLHRTEMGRVIDVNELLVYCSFTLVSYICTNNFYFHWFVHRSLDCFTREHVLSFITKFLHFFSANENESEKNLSEKRQYL